MGTNLPSASTYSNRKCCIVQTGIFPLTYQCNKYNLLKTWVVFHWTGAVLEAVLLAHRFNPLIKQPCYETFSSWQCWNPVISKDFDIPKKQIPGHVTEWNPPSFFRFRQRNRDRGWFHQIRESGFISLVKQAVSLKSKLKPVSVSTNGSRPILNTVVSEGRGQWTRPLWKCFQRPGDPSDVHTPLWCLDVHRGYLNVAASKICLQIVRFGNYPTAVHSFPTPVDLYGCLCAVVSTKIRNLLLTSVCDSDDRCSSPSIIP